VLAIVDVVVVVVLAAVVGVVVVVVVDVICLCVAATCCFSNLFKSSLGGVNFESFSDLCFREWRS